MERNTRQRAAIREAIAQAGRPLLPQEVLDAAQAGAPGLSIATVYRNLRTLLDEGELRSVMLPGENARYELAGGGHHHHFQCLRCQRVFEVEACPGNLAALAPPGFRVEDHDLTLYGRCAECVAASAPRGRASRAAPEPGRTGRHGHAQPQLTEQGHTHGQAHGQAHRHTHGRAPGHKHAIEHAHEPAHAHAPVATPVLAPARARKSVPARTPARAAAARKAPRTR